MTWAIQHPFEHNQNLHRHTHFLRPADFHPNPKLNMPDISPPPTKRRRLSHPPFTPPSAPAPSTTSAHTIPDPSLLRIFSWNINGITPFLQPPITSFFTPSTPPQTRRSSSTPPPPTPSLRACLHRWAWPEILCLQELKIAPHDPRTLAALTRSANPFPHDTGPDPGPAYFTFFALPHDPHNARGKIYGVATLVRTDFLHAQGSPAAGAGAGAGVKQVEWDREGRALVLELPRRRTVVVNVYALNGTGKPYRSATTGAVLGTRHERKRAFHGLLAGECAAYAARGWGVVVAGDMNVARGELDGWPGRRRGEEHVRSREDFEACFMDGEGGLGMVDSFRELHAGERAYTFRPRGREWGRSADRVDLVLLSRGEGEGLVVAGMLDSEAERGPSDHVPVFVGLRR